MANINNKFDNFSILQLMVTEKSLNFLRYSVFKIACTMRAQCVVAVIGIVFLFATTHKIEALKKLLLLQQNVCIAAAIALKFCRTAIAAEISSSNQL